MIFDGGLFDAAPPAPGDEVAAGRLALGAAALPPPLRVEGRVARPAAGIVQGWAYAPDEPQRRLTVEILARGRLVAATVADLPREDLAQAGIGDGRHGFLVDLSRVLRRGPHPITVRVPGARRPCRAAASASGRSRRTARSTFPAISTTRSRAVFWPAPRSSTWRSTPSRWRRAGWSRAWSTAFAASGWRPRRGSAG